MELSWLLLSLEIGYSAVVAAGKCPMGREERMSEQVPYSEM